MCAMNWDLILYSKKESLSHSNKELYDAGTPDLQKARRECKKLCLRYNRIDPTDAAQRAEFLRRLLQDVGQQVSIEAPFYCDYGFHITIGDHFEANHHLVILDGAEVTIGHHVYIGPNCCITTAGHPISVRERNQGLEFALPISIGNNVWIGAGVQILPGVTIGDNTVIGAGSVVTKDLPSNVVAIGVPCRVLRELTEEEKSI